jgi:hypothetical protein
LFIGPTLTRSSNGSAAGRAFPEFEDRGLEIPTESVARADEVIE